MKKLPINNNRDTIIMLPNLFSFLNGYTRIQQIMEDICVHEYQETRIHQCIWRPY